MSRAAVLLAAALLLAGCASPPGSEAEDRPPAQALAAGPAEGGVKMNSVSLQFVDYRNDPAELAARVDRMLAAAPSPDGGGDPIALVVPHAGYVYSGPVAAYAYRAVQGRRYDTVVVVGLSHRVPLRGISILDSASFETPLGSIPCDRDIIGSLLAAGDGLTYMPEAHSGEHSLEVQVPFLQRALKDFRIVFAVVGSPDPVAERAFVEDLARWRKKKRVLLVVSSDLSHYYPYELANRMDGVALRSIVALDAAGLRRDVQAQKCELCGISPVLALLDGAAKLGVTRAVLLRHANSGDTAGPADRVVGYAAVAFYGDEGAGKSDPPPAGASRLDGASRRELLDIARRSIEGAVREGRPPAPRTENPALLAPRGAFVTIKIGGRLRGCIGNFGIHDARPLYQTVSEMAAAAAVQDPRFPPLSEGELSRIELEISALSPLRPVADAAEIEVGRHGLYIRKGTRSGVLLPQVATEYGWDRETFLEQTCRKAGIGPDEWKEGASISVFEAEVFGEKDIRGEGRPL